MGSYANEPSRRPPGDLLFKSATAFVFVGIGTCSGYVSQAYSGLTQIFLLAVPCVFFVGTALLFADRTFRALIFGIALVFGVATQAFMDLGGADNPAVIIPWFGFSLAAGAALAEVVMLLRRRMRRQPRPKEV